MGDLPGAQQTPRARPLCAARFPPSRFSAEMRGRRSRGFVLISSLSSGQRSAEAARCCRLRRGVLRRKSRCKPVRKPFRVCTLISWRSVFMSVMHTVLNIVYYIIRQKTVKDEVKKKCKFCVLPVVCPGREQPAGGRALRPGCGVRIHALAQQAAPGPLCGSEASGGPRDLRS